MRPRLICSAAATAMLVFPAYADTLLSAAELRARPNVRARAVSVLPEGARVEVESASRGWSLINADGRRGYVATAIVAPAAVAEANCDRAYPYSGSDRYFDGLAGLRTSEPLGFLFGRHIRRPC
jgi:hypothetical protein